MAISLLFALIGHSADLELSTHPLVLGLINLIAFGYVIQQSVQRLGEPILIALPILKFNSRHLLPMLCTLAGSTVLISEMDNVALYFFPVPVELATMMIDLATGAQGIFATIFLANIVAPLTEELLFRGIILRGFLRVYSVPRSIFLSSALFAIIHLNPWQAIGAFVLGGLFGWWYVRTRSLLPCIVGHAAFNAIPVVLFGILGFEHPDPSAAVEFQPLWLSALGILLAGGGGLLLQKSFQAEIPVPVETWMNRIRSFADRLVDHARDGYGETTTPLFVSQIDTRTNEIPLSDTTLYTTDTRHGAGPTSNNLQFDGGLLRLMYGLSEYSDQTVYAESADDYLAYYLERLPLPSGHFPWGDHRGYDVTEDDVIDGHGEFKIALPTWDRMWEIDPEGVIRQADALRNHIIDPDKSLAFNRHYPPGIVPHCVNASAGAWVVLWTFVYTQTDEEKYLTWATEMDDYLWSLRNPKTDLLAAHPYDYAYPEIQDDADARQRASRTEYMGPMYSYAINLLRAHELLGRYKSSAFQDHALAYIRSFTDRFDITDEGHFFATFDIVTGEPLFDRISDGWQFTSQAQPDEASSGVIGLRAPISLAYAYRLTREPDLRESFDRFRPLFQIESFLDLDAPPMPIAAGLLAQAIGAWTNLYAATAEYTYLASAVALGYYASHHYVSNDWFVCGPPTDPKYRDHTLTGWETYSNRGGSADLALALLRLSAIADGRHELIEDDPTCYF